MIEKIFLTEEEQMLIQFINENLPAFANGDINWNHMRDYALQRAADYYMEQRVKDPIQRACMANNVNRTYYSKANIAKKRFL